MSRDDAEQSLARALSRHIGYTSGAYDLQRIFAVVEFFRTRTSGYAEEIVEELASKPDGNNASSGYLTDVISFASSFGMIEVVSTRESKLTRYAATELGRSVLGAFSVEDDSFRRFFLANVVLLADADFLVPLLLHIDKKLDVPLFEYFCSFAETLRTKRLEWLRTAFPQPVLFERIASHVGWLKKSKVGVTPYRVDIPTLNTARHHSTPRLGWLSELRLVEENRRNLTSFGADVLRAIVGDQNYFWVGPHPDALEALALSEPVPSATEADLRLNTGGAPATAAQVDRLARDTAAVMAQAFKEAKLIHADQASLRLPIGYIQYRSYTDRVYYDWLSTLAVVFEKNRDTLKRYSAHKGHVGFYKLIAT